MLYRYQLLDDFAIVTQSNSKGELIFLVHSNSADESAFSVHLSSGVCWMVSSINIHGRIVVLGSLNLRGCL